ncbi:MAG: hypothetical protein J5I90_17240 [Caldilineales bacterium]|nr:hypothetical protein [Caldilineales bacterium]
MGVEIGLEQPTSFDLDSMRFKLADYADSRFDLSGASHLNRRGDSDAAANAILYSNCTESVSEIDHGRAEQSSTDY